MNDLQQKLRDFVSSMEVSTDLDDEGCRYSGEWWVSGDDLPAWDFNREIVRPGHHDFPDGAIGIRVDDDFWVVGLIPYEYEPLSIQELVEVLWTYVTEPEFGKDVEGNT
jgi:hypothetical protein